MRKNDAIAVLGSNRALADLLGISLHAIYQWGPTVPRLREYEIREKIPDFNARLAAHGGAVASGEQQAAA